MARTKRETRAEARRRHREQQRAAEGAAATPAAVDAVAEKRPSLIENLGLNFKPPDVGADVRALPTIARHSWALALPLAAIVASFVLALDPSVYRLEGAAGDPITLIAARSLFQFVLLPPPVTPVFLGGVLASRGSWLVGGIVGVACTVAFLVLLRIHGPTTDFPQALSPATVGQAFSLLPIYILLGGFSGWYRRWLLSRQSRTRQATEERRRVKAREQRRERTAAARR